MNSSRAATAPGGIDLEADTARRIRNDRDYIVLCLGVIVLSFVLSAGAGGGAISLLGWRLPETCPSRAWLGLPCAGCGLTRSFLLTCRGRLVEAFAMHPIGPPLFVGVALQIPVRAWRMRQARLHALEGRVDPGIARWRPWWRGLQALTIAALLVQWIVRLAIGALPP